MSELNFFEQEERYKEYLFKCTVDYISGYDDGKTFQYKITKVYPNAFGRMIWVDLLAVHKDIRTHYTKHWSVQIGWLKKHNPDLFEVIEENYLSCQKT